jgi:hypothetical protein
VNGILFVAGGNVSIGFDTSPAVVGAVESYNPVTDSWTTGLAPMITARNSAPGLVLNGLFYVVGGATSTEIVATVEAYDPVANSWSSLAPMPVAQSAASGKAVNGALYSTGGWNGSAFMDNNQGGVPVICGPTPVPSPTPVYAGSNPPQPGGCFIYPSPSRGDQASVSYYMGGPGKMVLRIWNQNGVLVSNVDDRKPSGVQATSFSLSGFPTGVYYYQVTLNYDSGRVESIPTKKFAVLH